MFSFTGYLNRQLPFHLCISHHKFRESVHIIHSGDEPRRFISNYRLAPCNGLPLCSPIFTRNSKKDLNFLQCGVKILIQTQDHPRYQNIESTRTPRTSSGMVGKGGCCHVITSDAGRQSACAITRIAGKYWRQDIVTREVVINTVAFPYNPRNT